jgi:hypothetical protein
MFPGRSIAVPSRLAPYGGEPHERHDRHEAREASEQMPKLQHSQWLKVSIGCLVATIAFMIFYAAIPSAFIAWTDNWKIVKDNQTGTGLGPRIRDVAVMGWYGVITPLTFVAFSLYQKLNPVNADADESKREAGGYR